MKIAICGSGPSALEIAAKFWHMDASVTLFYRSCQLGGTIRRLLNIAPNISLNFAYEDITSEIGRNISGINNLKKIPTIKEYYNEYLSPLISKLSKEDIFKKGEVIRIHKRLLPISAYMENPKFRINDLFRVVYNYNPREDIQKQININRSVFSKLGEKTIDNLKKNIENFDDFDLVIDATGTLSNPVNAGPSNSLAINEISSNNVFYGLNVLDNLQEIKKKNKNITLIGNNIFTALTFLKLKDWLNNQENTLNFITNEEQPFKEFLNSDKNMELINNIKDMISSHLTIWNKKCDQFEKDIMKYRNQSQSTIKPKEPRPQLIMMTNTNISSIDKLEDKKELFITCENKQSKIKTLKSDCLLVINGFETSHHIFSGLNTDYKSGFSTTTSNSCIHKKEPGFYTIGPVNDSYNLKEIILHIDYIKDNILSFFSKVK